MFKKVLFIVSLSLVFLGCSTSGISESVHTVTPTPSVTTTVSVETSIERIERLALEFNLTVIVAECEIVEALACYYPYNKSIIVTPYGLTYSDSVLSCALKHEARHKYQDENGLILYNSDGSIANRDWLEADAYNNGCK